MTDTFRYVNTDSTAGGNGTTNATTGANRAYASLDEWDIAEATTVATGDRHICYVDGSAVDTGGATIQTPWSIADVDGLQIRTNDSNNDTVNGAATGTTNHGFQRGVGYKIQVASNNALSISIDNLLCYGFEVESTSASHNGIICTAGTQRFEAMLARSANTTGGAAFRPIDAEFINCWAYGGWVGYLPPNSSTANMRLYNCCDTDCTYGVAAQSAGAPSGTAPDIRNHYSFNAGTEDYFNGGLGWNASCATNATSGSDNTDKPAVTQLSILAAEFLDEPNDDFRLDPNYLSSLLQGNGTDLSGTFTTDAIGTTRSNWDIGPFEAVAAGGGLLPLLMAYQ